MDDERQKAEQAGYEARLRGRPEYENPHTEGTELALAWDRGWHELEHQIG